MSIHYPPTLPHWVPEYYQAPGTGKDNDRNKWSILAEGLSSRHRRPTRKLLGELGKVPKKVPSTSSHGMERGWLGKDERG